MPPDLPVGWVRPARTDAAEDAEVIRATEAIVYRTAPATTCLNLIGRWALLLALLVFCAMALALVAAWRA
jgi:hypothetical protein